MQYNIPSNQYRYNIFIGHILHANVKAHISVLTFKVKAQDEKLETFVY